MVFYRKYRPQTVSELDLKEVREKLSNILSSKEIPHAFLFTGPRGLGKTSSARILAKAINCKNKKDIEPCNKCEICKSITDGTHIDIIEIDAASNRGVDEIRSLREKVKYSPSELEKKVYIIDEVHMLTNEAFNALLKTLEEPPSHVVFILATTEAHKIPQTILSRTFNVKFEKPSEDEITNSLLRITKGEGLTVDKDVYEDIFRLSEGSFRDAAKILEELSLSSKGEKITNDLLEKTFKTGSVRTQAEKLVELFYQRKLEESLFVVNNMAEEGIDFKMVIEEMVGIIRDKIEEKDIRDTKEILTLLNEAYSNLKFSVLPQLPLEIAVMEFCSKIELETKADVEKVAEKPEEKTEKKKEVLIPEKSKETDFLQKLIEAVHPRDKRVAAFLRSCKEASVEGSSLVLKTPYAIHAKKLMSVEFRQVIMESVFDLNKEIKDLQVDTV